MSLEISPHILCVYSHEGDLVCEGNYMSAPHTESKLHLRFTVKQAKQLIKQLKAEIKKRTCKKCGLVK